MSKNFVKVLIALLLIIGGFFAWKFYFKTGKREKKTYREMSVTRGVIENVIEASGEVAPLNRVEIKPPVQGRIESILVEEGATVKAGQILAWMSSSDRAAVLDAARAKGAEEVKKWQDAYQPTPIVAPLSGSIILRNVVVGQTIDSSTILFALSDKLIVLAHVDEVDIARIKNEMPADITLDSYPTEKIQGTVASILYEGKNVSNVITYGVKVTPKKAPAFLRSQMTATVRFLLERKEDVLLLPSSAIQTLPNGGKQVLIPQPEDSPSPVTVTVGSENGEKTEILSGLAEGDKVMVASQHYSPQKGSASSPLVAGGPSNSGNRSGGGNRPR